MKKRQVRFLATASADVTSIFDWIGEVVNQPATARSFILRIYERCEQLADFPELGVARDDLLPGLRFLSFENRIAIFYVIRDKEIQITNVFYRGRDYDSFDFQN